MAKKLFKKIPGWIKWLVILIILALVGYAIWFLAGKNSSKLPPPEFLTARQNGAEISRKIVELASSTKSQIDEIHSLDLDGDYSKAQDLIEQVKDKNSQANSEAIKLADEMRKMTESLDKITAVKSRQLAIEAISSEMSLIANFIDYTADLENFLNNLRFAFATSKKEYRDAAEFNLSDLNAKTWTINGLNQQFLSKMSDFDRSFSH